MLFEEYKKIFEEVLSLTEKIEELCEKSRSDETDELFHKRSALMQKLEVPEDLDDEKFAQIIEIKDKIFAKNDNILNAMQKEKEKADEELKEIQSKVNTSPSAAVEIKTNEQKKGPKANPGDSSIFS